MLEVPHYPLAPYEINVTWTFSKSGQIQGGEIKRDPEIGSTAMQPEPAQTADLSISGSRLISSLCRETTLTKIWTSDYIIFDQVLICHSFAW